MSDLFKDAERRVIRRYFEDGFSELAMGINGLFFAGVLLSMNGEPTRWIYVAILFTEIINGVIAYFQKLTVEPRTGYFKASSRVQLTGYTLTITGPIAIPILIALVGLLAAAVYFDVVGAVLRLNVGWLPLVLAGFISTSLVIADRRGAKMPRLSLFAAILFVTGLAVTLLNITPAVTSLGAYSLVTAPLFLIIGVFNLIRFLNAHPVEDANYEPA